MSERPILMNTDMVRAILEGRKTVTRRVMKPQPVLDGHFWRLGGAGWGDNISSFHPVPCHSLYNHAPYHPGDILWVRETWRNAVLDVSQYSFGEVVNEESYDGYQYKEDMSFNFPNRPCEKFDPEYYIVSPSAVGRWRPSIHMPREAARIFLRVTDVRVERLQCLTLEQAHMEGQPRCNGGLAVCGGPQNCQDCEMDTKNAVRWFSEIWDSTIKPADRAAYGWEANPWVWVISFERISEEGNQ